MVVDEEYYFLPSFIFLLTWVHVLDTRCAPPRVNEVKEYHGRVITKLGDALSH